MGRSAVIWSFLAGVLLATVLAAVGWLFLAQQTGQPQRTPDAPPLATLMTRVAGQLVAADTNDARYGIAIYFDQPLPYGEVLCRVNRYQFAQRVVRGRAVWPQDRWEDPLKVEMMFGVWADPTDSKSMAAGRETACGRYRDFHRLISGDGSAVERVVNVLAQAIRDAKAGSANYAVTCIDRRANPQAAQPCDGLALMRATRLQHIGDVQDAEGFDGIAPARGFYRDLVSMDPLVAGSGCGQTETLTYKLVSEQTGSMVDAALRRVEIARDVIC